MDSSQVQSALLGIAIFLVAVKFASTFWLVSRPDATTVTATPRGRAVYFVSKVTPALFVAAMFARAYLHGASSGYLAFWAVLFVVAVVMAVAVARQRAAGKWYGYAHEFRQRRRRRRGP